MFGDIEYALRDNLRDREYAQEYAAAFLNAYIATQIKVIREQRKMTQADLGREIGTTQTGISRYEDVNYSSWSLRTLQKLAHAFDVRLRVSFEPYGTLPDEVVRFDRARLQRVERAKDPALTKQVSDNNCDTGVTDIGVVKALKGTMNKIDENTEGHQDYARDNSSTGEIPGDVGVGRVDQWGQNSDLGLRSTVGGIF